MPRSDAVNDFMCLDPPMLALRNLRIDKDSGALRYPKRTQIGLGQGGEEMLAQVWQCLAREESEAMSKFRDKSGIAAAVIL